MEKELLQIRPLVPKEKQVYQVKFEPVEQFLVEMGITKDYLLITTPGVYYAIRDKLQGEPGKDFTYIYVSDAKEDRLSDLQTLYNETIESDAAYAKVAKEPVTVQEAKTLDLAFKKKVSCVLCTGGGVAMDAGKFIAHALNGLYQAEGIVDESGKAKKVDLYTVPTVLSVNAGYCYKAAIREKDPYDPTGEAYNVVYRKKGLPKAICVDLDVITSAASLQYLQENKELWDQPTEAMYQAENLWNMLRELNIAGAGDLLSMLTATYDWQINSLVARDMVAVEPNAPLDESQKVKLEKPFSRDVCDGAMELIGLLAEHADEIREGKKEGAEFIARAYHWIAEQSVIMDHTMWESASEHGMFDCFENRAGVELTHGKVVALSVYFMSLLQCNQHDRALNMIRRLGLDISLGNLAIDSRNNRKVTPLVLYKSLAELRQYIDEINYRYTIISAKPITDEWVLAALDKYYKDIYEGLAEQYRNALYDNRILNEENNHKEKARLAAIAEKVDQDYQSHKQAMEAARSAEAAMLKSQKEVIERATMASEKMSAYRKIAQAKTEAYVETLKNIYQ
ncbi:MAG: iron-containing alcohol dehydrogenase family protein [Ruminococcaceae bacterium]|nr:iron-containing alcohol dehydrogenase family protein [Oscillospiraceae bacterium]